MFIISFIILLLSSINNGTVFWYNYTLNNILLTFLSSISGIIVILLISVKIDQSKILEWFGQNTLIIYSCQFIVYRIFTTVVFKLMHGINNYICILISFILSLISLYFICNIYNYLKKSLHNHCQ